MQLNYQKRYIYFFGKIHLRSQDFYMKSGLITQGKVVIFHNITHESLSGSLIEFQYFDPWILWVPYTT